LSTGFKFENDGTEEVLPTIVHPSGKTLKLCLQGSDDLEVALDRPRLIFWENDYMDNAQRLGAAFHEVKERQILTDCMVAVHE